jgi:hypothetical protein
VKWAFRLPAENHSHQPRTAKQFYVSHLIFGEDPKESLQMVIAFPTIRAYRCLFENMFAFLTCHSSGR